MAYGTGGNFGSAISADQVNLQTQNLEVEFVPAKYWTINVGLQRLFDTPHDLYRTFFEKFTSTGYRLAYFGTDGVGISVRRQTDGKKLKAGFYKLYENNVELNDDVSLFELNQQITVSPKWNVGGSVYYIKDNSSGKGGVSILGQGYSSPLTTYNGTFRFPLGADPYKSDVFWVGMYFSRNEEMINARRKQKGWEVFVRVESGKGSTSSGVVELLVNEEKTGEEKVSLDPSEGQRLEFLIETTEACSVECRLRPDGFDSLEADKAGYLELPVQRPLVVSCAEELTTFRRALKTFSQLEIVGEVEAGGEARRVDCLISDVPQVRGSKRR